MPRPIDKAYLFSSLLPLRPGVAFYIRETPHRNLLVDEYNKFALASLPPSGWLVCFLDKSNQDKYHLEKVTIFTVLCNWVWVQGIIIKVFPPFSRKPFLLANERLAFLSIGENIILTTNAYAIVTPQ